MNKYCTLLFIITPYCRVHNSNMTAKNLIMSIVAVLSYVSNCLDALKGDLLMQFEAQLEFLAEEVRLMKQENEKLKSEIQKREVNESFKCFGAEKVKQGESVKFPDCTYGLDLVKNGVFTAQVAGFYHFKFHLGFTNS